MDDEEPTHGDYDKIRKTIILKQMMKRMKRTGNNCVVAPQKKRSSLSLMLLRVFVDEIDCLLSTKNSHAC